MKVTGQSSKFRRSSWDSVGRTHFTKGSRDPRPSSSFFFTSFPDEFKSRDLYEEFKGFSNIDEVVIPAKRGVKGKIWLCEVL